MNATKRRALHFVLLIGILSFFADFVYEGGRAIAGPFLAVLGATGAIVGTASGASNGNHLGGVNYCDCDFDDVCVCTHTTNVP
ncbi:MAG TPA: hypothetical protein VLV45_13450 [Gemmatimonadales bacterium]|nr:hypothetical protein [Gemmatimonadales bacterium]